MNAQTTYTAVSFGQTVTIDPDHIAEYESLLRASYRYGAEREKAAETALFHNRRRWAVKPYGVAYRKHLNAEHDAIMRGADLMSDHKEAIDLLHSFSMELRLGYGNPYADEVQRIAYERLFADGTIAI